MFVLLRNATVKTNIDILNVGNYNTGVNWEKIKINKINKCGQLVCQIKMQSESERFYTCSLHFIWRRRFIGDIETCQCTISQVLTPAFVSDFLSVPEVVALQSLSTLPKLWSTPHGLSLSSLYPWLGFRWEAWIPLKPMAQRVHP